MSLERQAREKIYAKVSDLVKRKHFDPAMNGADWNALASARKDQILRSASDEEFETKMQELLNELKTSHTGFRHAKARTFPDGTQSAPRSCASIWMVSNAGCFRMFTREDRRIQQAYGPGTSSSKSEIVSCARPTLQSFRSEKIRSTPSKSRTENG